MQNRTLNTTKPYHAFGSSMAGRDFNNTSYKYGFNNQEQDKELGQYYAFEYRIHDARLGRFLSVDPLVKDYPWNSPYAFAENRVIDGIDLEGLEFTKHINRESLEARIKGLIADPISINQGGAGTCTIASMVYIWIKNDPEGFKNSLMQLYENGSVKVNNYNIEPDNHLFEVNITHNSDVYSGNGGHYSADWMILSSIQDSQNSFYDFDGTSSDDKGDGSYKSDQVELMKNLLNYDKVEVFDLKESYSNGDDLFNKLNELNKTKDVVSLNINASLINKKIDGGHSVTLIQNTLNSYQDDSGNMHYTFDVQSWGKTYSVDASASDLATKVNNAVTGTNTALPAANE